MGIKRQRNPCNPRRLYRPTGATRLARADAACCPADCANVYRFDSCPALTGDWCVGFTNTIYVCEDVACEGGGSINGKVIRYHGLCWTQSEDDSLIPIASVPSGATVVTAADAPSGVECVGTMDPEDPCGDIPCDEAVFYKLVPCDEAYAGDTFYICATCATRCRSVCHADTCFLIDVDVAYTLAEVTADSGEIISSCTPVPSEDTPDRDDCCDCGDTCDWEDLCRRDCQIYYWRKPDEPYDACHTSLTEPITYTGDAECCCPAKADGEGYTLSVYCYYRNLITYATGATILYEGTVGPSVGTGHDRTGAVSVAMTITRTDRDEDGVITAVTPFETAAGVTQCCPINPALPGLVTLGVVGPWYNDGGSYRLADGVSLVVEQTCASWAANYHYDNTDSEGNISTIDFIMVVAVTPPTDRPECYTECADVATTGARSAGSCCGG